MSSQEAKPEQRERKILVSESMEPGRASQVRKSLAWDSAFFTSAGVLDPEELCIINRGFEKSEAHLVVKVRKDQCKRIRIVTYHHAPHPTTTAVYSIDNDPTEKSPVLSVLNFGTRSVLSNTNGEDLDKPQPASLLAVKGGSEPTGVIMARHAPQSQEQEENPPTLKNCPWKPSKVESHISQLCRENLSKSREVSDGGYDKRKIGLNYSSKEERKRREEIMKNEMIRDSKAEPLVHSEGNGRARRHHHLENILPAPHKDEKENSSTLDDRVHGLCRNFEAIDVSRDTAIDLNGMKKKKGLCNPIFDGNFTKMETTAVEVIPNPRTPLVDRNSVFTVADSFGFTTG